MILKKINNLFRELKEKIKLIPIHIACYLEDIFGDPPCLSNDEEVIKDWNIQRDIIWPSLTLKETLLE